MNSDIDDYKQRSADQILRYIAELATLSASIIIRARLERRRYDELRDIKNHLSSALSALRQINY